MNRNVSILYPEWENSLKMMTTDDHCYFPSRTTLTSLKGGVHRTWCHLEDFCNLLRLEATSSLSSSASKRQDIRCNVWHGKLLLPVIPVSGHNILCDISDKTSDMKEQVLDMTCERPLIFIHLEGVYQSRRSFCFALTTTEETQKASSDLRKRQLLCYM